jgi:MoxR-like ATPase
MLITESKELIKNCAKANKTLYPIMQVGVMGIGKTQIVEQVCQELTKELGEDFGFVDLRLATHEAADLIGYPYIDEKTTKISKEKYKVLRHARPEWFPEEGTRGIIHLDELNRAPTDVRQAIFQLIHERRLHTHKLPDGWFIVASINPDNGAYQVETLDKAMYRRFCVIKVRTSSELFLVWAKKANKDSKITGFVSTHPELLFKDDEFSVELEHTPDQYSALSDYIAAGVIPENLFAEVAIGFLGRTAAIALEKWIQEDYKRPVTGKEILEDFDKIKEKLKAQKSHEWASTLRDLTAEMFSSDSPTKDKVDNLAKFVREAPPDTVAAFMSKLPPKYCNALVSRRAITDIASRTLKASKE